MQLPNESDPKLREIANTVFTRLQRVGPLCPSQLSLDLGLGINTVSDALVLLWKQGVAERSTAPSYPFDGQNETANYEDAWRIRFRGKKERLKRTEQFERGELEIH